MMNSFTTVMFEQITILRFGVDCMEHFSGDILYVVVPAYNEQENIEDVVNEWYEVLKLGGARQSFGYCG